MTDAEYKVLLDAWGISFAGEDPSCPMDGSPERSAARTVVSDPTGARWILEQIEPDNIARKQQVAEQLERLEKSGLSQIHPWKKTLANSFFQTLENNEGKGSRLCQPPSPRLRRPRGSGGQAAFMLRPYIDGVSLNRKTYLYDEWRIEEMARFLIQLREKTATHPGLRPPLRRRGAETIPSLGGVRDVSAGASWPPKPRRRGLAEEEAGGGFFSIVAYAEGRMTEWRKHYSKLAEKLEPSFGLLQKNFFHAHDRLPRAFCHGDYHPLNMIWGDGEIRSVIDWEFCGIKPELYDVALLLGCIGFEDPDYLIKAPAIQLVQTLRAAGFGSPDSWEYLLDLAAVIRYGWMSEWIRRSDKDARRMEAVYIDILVDQKDYILQKWKM